MKPERLDVFEELKKITLFEGCDKIAILDLCGKARIRTFSKEIVIFDTYDNNEFLYFVLRGSVCAVHYAGDCEKGDYAISRVYGSFEGLNCGSVWDDASEGELFTAVAGGEGAILLLIRKCHLLQLLKKYPSFCFEYSKYLRKIEKAYLKHVVHLLCYDNIEQRLIRCLRVLSRKNGENYVYPLGIHTHEKLARMIGKTRESVTRSLGKLNSMGILRTNERRRIMGINLPD
ncbi:MAG: Crp/Fnr family transcriptional regulator [Candidatus Moranbacteria bacterium]|nr:Crp/Fnr family transcriptional regulator [Candidatus Moranbacteria bacterium]